MVILSALLRLRQICCDLRLLKLEEVDPATASGKLELFSELLEEVIDGGHRVLVFSQFVSMLALIRERFDAEGVRFCYLDGSTTNRGEVVARFQTDPAIPVFLISLKAGGVGLNLTGADTVIHFDPWWNPAVEAQATDRAHRDSGVWPGVDGQWFGKVVAPGLASNVKDVPAFRVTFVINEMHDTFTVHGSLRLYAAVRSREKFDVLRFGESIREEDQTQTSTDEQALMFHDAVALWTFDLRHVKATVSW